MEEAFVIMKIGDEELDNIWRNVYIPAIKECGLEPKRVDKHNEGRLLTSEIAEFIKRAKIIIADLTAERPNCYLEIGYAMGKDKFTNLILCIKNNHKVHFDLGGYELIKWDETNLDMFRRILIKKIKYRLKILTSLGRKTEEKDKIIEDWINGESKRAIENLKDLSKKSNIDYSFFEIIFQPVLKKEIKIKKINDLKEIARKAECHNTGWPIAVTLDRDDFKPKRVEHGYRAIIKFPPHFDYWMLRKDGNFYFLRNLELETENEKKVLYFDTRTYRVAESFLYCSRLYKGLGLKDTDRIKISITHSGLKDRVLTTADPRRIPFQSDKCGVNHATYKFEDTLENIQKNIKANVYEVVDDLFLYFDRSIGKDVIDRIVEEFLQHST